MQQANSVTKTENDQSMPPQNDEGGAGFSPAQDLEAESENMYFDQNPNRVEAQDRDQDDQQAQKLLSEQAELEAFEQEQLEIHNQQLTIEALNQLDATYIFQNE